jgi:8-oxo-dGTP pyrophosphatase MutT (NUDIX family)
MRELREETGKRIDEKSIITSLSSNKSKLFIAAGDFSPRCRVDMREIDEYAWVNLSELKNLKTSKFTQSFFKKIEVFMQ